MLMNNLDPEVAERPEDLVVYGGTGKAARDWGAFDQIVSSLRSLGDEETLLVQSGKPIGILQSHPDAPRVLIANSNLVPHWATWEHFWDLEKRGLTMYGQMTAGSWIYIGTQGILQGTYETFCQAGRTHFGSDDLRGAYHPSRLAWAAWAEPNPLPRRWPAPPFWASRSTKQERADDTRRATWTFWRRISTPRWPRCVRPRPNGVRSRSA